MYPNWKSIMYLTFCQTVGGITSIYSLNSFRKRMYCSSWISPVVSPFLNWFTASRSSPLDLYSGFILKSKGPKYFI